MVIAGLDPAIQQPPGTFVREGGGYWIAACAGNVEQKGNER
jgi:hypothetical protein